MRNNYHSFLHSNPNYNANNPSCLIDGSETFSPLCNVSSRNRFIRASKYEFNSCIWRSCEGSQGGAIYVTVSSSEATLTVSHCEFHNCKSSSEGGAIYASQIGEVTLRNSIFDSCHAVYASNNGGGGIQMFHIKTQSFISESYFSRCTCYEDGGAISNRYSYAKKQYIICKSCLFISNEAKVDGGGAFEFWEFYNPMGCTDTLFCTNNAKRGGAVSIGGGYVSVPEKVISFCFFHGNLAPGKGNDFCTFPYMSKNPFLHSFTTAELNRNCYYDSNWHPYPLDNNLLPKLIT